MADYERLIKWINLEQLQNLQDTLYNMTGMPVVTVDLSGHLLTKPSGQVAYCDEFAHKSARCEMLCAQCRHYGAREEEASTTEARGDSLSGSVYTCHMGLLECSAPIKVDGQMVACLVTGHIFERAPKKEQIRAYADRYHFDFDELWAAAQQVKIVDMTAILQVAHSLHSIAALVADNATCRMEKEMATIEMTRASQLKNDFLANMSHEIRTPMNAVVGLTDIAMQEEMSSSVRDYLEQIKSSSNSLLHIINDILDYSKISSGKMELFEEEYKPAVVLRDVATIISSRLRDKSDKVDLLIDIDAKLPSALFGDGPRIQQILINLANNAVKFTQEGHVSIRVQYEKTDLDTAKLTFRIEDTGIGIKREDIGKLFKSFSQVDSRRNRAIEGTGLGLAIVQQLVELMGGTVRVESEYGKGSVFWVEIPQKIVSNDVAIKCEKPTLFECIGIFDHSSVGNHFEVTLDSLNVHSNLRMPKDINYTILTDWLNTNRDKQCYLFLEEKFATASFMEMLSAVMKEHTNFHRVIVIDAYADDRAWQKQADLQVIRKPLHTLNLAMLLEKDTIFNAIPVEKTEEADRKFSATEANVLVVDDVSMNLKVALRLLERYGIAADGVSSGVAALDQMLLKEYDLIFMDHMMPGIDGIDTTRIIRRFHPKMNGIPIVALTANVMGDAKKMFLEEGMNDLLSKPINVKELGRILTRWLPPNKIQYLDD